MDQEEDIDMYKILFIYNQIKNGWKISKGKKENTFNFEKKINNNEINLMLRNNKLNFELIKI